MKRTISVLVGVCLFIFFVGVASAQNSDDTQQEIQALKAAIAKLQMKVQELEKKTVNAQKQRKRVKANTKDLDHRLMKVERKSALDRINFSGDFRFEVHTINATVPDHYDGMQLQNLLVNTMFYYGNTGMMPSDMSNVNSYIASHYGDYLYFTDHLTFDQLGQMMGQFPPDMQQQLFGMLLPGTFRKGYSADNSILYTNRLRLNMDAKIAKNVSFHGRLSMYKVWGDSTGVQVFNGQANSFDIDGNTVGVPNSDQLRVERAFFTWSNIGGLPLYVSIGRRPSTYGPPMNIREGEMRGGTPMGTLIDFQFDGLTVGYHLNDYSTLRVCYGLGYEAGFGNADILRQPADRLNDAQFLGLNWDIWNSDTMLIQTTIARAYNVTDGFNGKIVLPNNPVTGQAIGAPVVMRFTPSANLGNINIGGFLLQRRDGPLDWFVNYNFMHSDPNGKTTPFGGLFSDPFEIPKSHTGHFIYAGGRLNFNDDKTMVGVEYNHGSKYWFNFTPAQDDIIAPKTNTRGNVWELYLMHKIYRRFLVKLDFINYDYNYSGSGWHLGSPKKLNSSPILGYPTYDDAWKLSLTAFVHF